jgi:hypothetical protein
VAQIADGLEVVQAEGATAAVVQQQRVPFDPLPELPGRTEALYRLHLRGVKPGEWWMRIQVDAESLQNPLHRDVKLRVNATNGQAARTAPGAVNSGAPR